MLACCFHHMGVNIGSGGNLSMSQPLGDADAVHAVEIQYGGHRVAERMGVDVGQSATFCICAGAALFLPAGQQLLSG